ncbi:MAG: Rpn family recombination-promoting nuclease/putative transposase [Janthinobacterium lividum]
MRAKYLDPFTDFGFKRIFGQEASKPLLRDFLNALLPPTAQIQTLTFKNNEQAGVGAGERKAIFDIYCENEHGEKFIVELQKAKQNHFKDRTVFYSTFPIREQAEAGTWDFALKAVYCVGILDFVFNDPPTAGMGEVLHEVKLKNQHGAVFYNKLTYYYLEMPNFRKSEAELTTRLDQWLYFLKHLEELQAIPQLFGDAVFTQAFEAAALGQMSFAEMDQYEGSLKRYRDEINTTQYAIEQGLAQGREQGIAQGREQGIAQGREEGREEGLKAGILQVAQALKAAGMPLESIAAATGLTAVEVAALPPA